MNTSEITRKALVVIAILGLAATARILWKRAVYEGANRTVEVVVDMKALRAAAPPDASDEYLIGRLSKIGVKAAGVYEYKAEEMLASGELTMLRRRAWGGGGAAGLRMDVPDARIREIAKKHLNAYFGAAACPEGRTWCLTPDFGKERLKDFTLGLEAERPGMEISPRFFNTPFENQDSIRLKLQTLAELPEPSLVIFDGKSALGFPDLLEHTALGIRSAEGWNFGFVELTPQDGSERLARNLPGRVIPVHSISDEELAELAPRKAVDRYRRAVRERGIRAIYVRPYTALHGRRPEQALTENLEYIDDLVRSLREDGFETGKAKPLPPFIVSGPLRGLCIAGAVALTGLLAGAVFGFPAWATLACAALCMAAVAALPDGSPFLRYFLKLAALGTACCVPALSVATFFLPKNANQPARPVGAAGNVALLAAACALTMAGGAAASAMLASREYFLRQDVFTGVKLAFLVPVIIIFFLYLMKTGLRFRDFLDSPVRYVEFGAGLLILAAMVIYLLRSGNEGPSQVGGFDSAVRDFLESLFFARPRTKEFVIGHPALLLAGLYPATRKSFFPFVLLMMGVIGQVSVFNTFCHLHTPLTVTWYRLALGLALGAAGGLALRAVFPLAFGKNRP